ncbi:hypothetical protein Tco_0790574 [Tanacetum coccineum]
MINEAKLVEEFYEAEANEEKFLYQQAKIKWLCEGDKNSSLEEADKMVSEVSDKEIKEALFDIEDSKAPGPDGFSSAFFKKAWRVIGPDICKAVKEFFMSRKMLGELNATLISLIPKVQTPDKVTDFRPIACCNVLSYKQNQAHSWKAGRLQLITAVLESIHVYWAQVFLLPAIIIKDINRLLKSFLWNQSEKTTGKAKMAWSSICRPKDQGGLGLKNLQILGLMHAQRHSGTLKLRKIHFGSNGSILSNSEEKSRIGPLVQYLTHMDLYDERLNEELKVSDMIINGMWSLPDEWYEKFPLITSLEVPDIEIKREDKLLETKFDKE